MAIAVVKVGTSSITSAARRDRRRVAAEAVRGDRRRPRRRPRGGAGDLGRDRRRAPRVGSSTRPTDIGTLQAVAAVGQPLLMERLGALLGAHGLLAGQVLLTPHDFGVRSQYLHARDTLRRLLDLGVVPVVNENDTVADDEIRYGDNDRLAALVSHLVGADVLVLLTDTAGLFTADPRVDAEASLIEEIVEVDAALEALAGGTGTERGSGGMATKLAAAKIAAWSGVRAVIAAADAPDVVTDAIAGRAVGTACSREPYRLSSRKLWIAFARGAAGTHRRRRRCPPRAVFGQPLAAAGGSARRRGLLRRRRRGRDRRRFDGVPFAKGLVRYSAAGAPTGRGPSDVRARGGAGARGRPPRRPGGPSVIRVTRSCAVGSVPSHSCLTSSSSTGGGRVLSRGLRRSTRSGRKVRPGRLGRCAPRGRAAAGRHGLTPPESPIGLPKSGLVAGRSGSCGPGVTLARMSAPTRRVRTGAPGAGRGHRAGVGVDRRQERRPPRRAPTCLADRAAELLAANRLDVEAAVAAGLEPGPLDRLRLTEARIAGMADGLRYGRGAARPDR